MRAILYSAGIAVFLTALSPKPKAKLPDEFVRIPAGTYSLDEPGGTSQERKQVTITGFYISKYEVSNQQYREFIKAVLPSLPEAEKEKVICDSTGWKQVMGYSEPLVNYYYSHPSYNDYPVLNIHREGAEKYCEWLEKKIQEDNPGYEVEVRLPARQEWIWAAMGGRSQAMFPWTNYYLQNKKGEYLCNFKKVNDFQVVRNRYTGLPEINPNEPNFANAGLLTANIRSYYPNDYGLYNMCGNVAEMVLEKKVCVGGSWNDYGGDVHIRAQAKFNELSPTVGFRPIIIVKERSRK